MTAAPRHLHLAFEMKQLFLRAALLAVLATVAFAAVSPAAASEASREPAPIVRQWQPKAGGAPGQSVEPILLWTIAGVGGGAVVFAGLYLLKRRLGGFPRNPAWVAPISILRSRDSADETTFGAAAPGGHDSQH